VQILGCGVKLRCNKGKADGGRGGRELEREIEEEKWQVDEGEGIEKGEERREEKERDKQESWQKGKGRKRE
jgi:hypothetical protein